MPPRPLVIVCVVSGVAGVLMSRADISLHWVLVPCFAVTALSQLRVALAAKATGTFIGRQEARAALSMSVGAALIAGANVGGLPFEAGMVLTCTGFGFLLRASYIRSRSPVVSA